MENDKIAINKNLTNVATKKRISSKKKKKEWGKNVVCIRVKEIKATAWVGVDVWNL